MRIGLADAFQNFHSARFAFSQVQIQEDRVGRFFFQIVKERDGILKIRAAEAFGLQRKTGDFAEILLVINDDHGFVHSTTYLAEICLFCNDK